MSWVKLDDAFHRNHKQLRMSNAAFRLYVCALSYCAEELEPTGYMSIEQADSLRRAVRQSAKTIEELVELNAWEAINGGYLIHDYEEYLFRGSRERTREWREKKRHRDVTDASPERHSRVRGNPVPEPVVITPPVRPPSPGGPVEKSPELSSVAD